MNNEAIHALKDLGLEITDVQYKYTPDDEFGITFDQPTKFILKGAFYEEKDLKQLLREIQILRAVYKNTNPAVADLYGQLKTAIGLTNE